MQGWDRQIASFDSLRMRSCPDVAETEPHPEPVDGRTAPAAAWGKSASLIGLSSSFACGASLNLVPSPRGEGKF